jgi:hypothetical protein
MTNEYLTMTIDYKANGLFKISGNVKEDQQIEVLETFLKRQAGAGVDIRRPDYKDNYQISLKLNLENNKIEATCNTGNYEFRDGILRIILKKL